MIMSEIKHNSNKSNKNKGLEINNIGINSDIIRGDIEKSYNIDPSNGTEAYYSDRYGWTLRKPITL